MGENRMTAIVDIEQLAELAEDLAGMRETFNVKPLAGELVVVTVDDPIAGELPTYQTWLGEGAMDVVRETL